MGYQNTDGVWPFQKRVLVPFWVFRLLFMIIAVVFYALIIAAYGVADSQRDDTGISYGTAIGIAVVVLVSVGACLVVDIVCIVKYHKRTLTPKFFLVCNVIQTSIFLIWFILGFIGARTLGSIIVNVIVMISFLGLLIYASVIYHRQRKGTLAKHYGSAGSTNGFASDVEYGRPAMHPPFNTSQYVQPSNQYYPPQQAQQAAEPYYAAQPHGIESHEMGRRYN